MSEGRFLCMRRTTVIAVKKCKSRNELVAKTTHPRHERPLPHTVHLKLCSDPIKRRSTKNDSLQINCSSADTVSFGEQREVACTSVQTITNRTGLSLDWTSPPLLRFTSHRYVAGLGLAHQPSSEFIRGARAAAVCTGESARGVGVFSFLPVIKERDQTAFSARARLPPCGEPPR